MSSIAFEASAARDSLLVSETGVERLQLVGGIGSSTFLMGGPQKEGEATSGPNPYELLSASLAACTAMTVRLYSDRKGYPLDRVQVAVSFQRSPVEGRDRSIARSFSTGLWTKINGRGSCSWLISVPSGKRWAAAQTSRHF